jgi:succinylglutamate desuccinylase
MQAIQQDQHTHKEEALKHCIGDVKGHINGPTIVAVAGIHGNEPTGVEAIEYLIDQLEPNKEFLKGRFIGLRGNLKALEKNVRFVDEDMNRLWVTSMLDKIRRTPFEDLKSSERKEVKELLSILDPIVYSNEELIYIDLHTFSNKGAMFTITPKETRHINLISTLKIPLVFGIEHTLIGTSMEYVEEAGHLGFAFESGTHGSEIAKHNAIAGLMTLMVDGGYFPAEKLDKFDMYFSYLMDKVDGFPHKLDFVYKHLIEEKDEFLMNPGFKNFDPVKKGDWLATDKHGKIKAQNDGYLLMPLYQQQGYDGFFIVRNSE